MSSLHQQAEDKIAAEATRTNRAFRLLLVIGIFFGLASTIILIRLIGNSGSDFDDFLEAALGIGASLFVLAGAFLARKGRVTLAIILTAVALFGLDLFLISRLSTIGFPLSISVTLILILLASQTLPPKNVTGGVVLIFITGSLLIVIDLFWTANRGNVDSVDLPVIYGTLTFLVILALAVAVRQFPKFSLGTKLVSAVLTMVVITVTLTTVVVNEITRRNLTDRLHENFETLSTAQASAVSALLGQEVSVLQAFSLDSTLPGFIRTNEQDNYSGSEAEIRETIAQTNVHWLTAPEGSGIINQYRNNAAAAILRRFQASFPQHADMLLTNRYGALVGMANDAALFDNSGEAWWQAAYNNGEGAIYIDLPAQNAGTGTVGIPIALPIYAGDEVIGVLRSTLRLDQFSALLDETGSFGESIQSDLLFGDLALHHEDDHEAGELHLEPLGIDPATLYLLQVGEMHFTQDTLEGAESHIHLAPISTAGHIPTVDTLNWSIVVHQPLEQAFAAVAAQQRVSIVMALIAIAVGGSLAALFARQRTAPVLRLTETAVRISEGDINRQALVETEDEIGVLAQAFNNMTAQLRSLIGSLEMRVADRTRALETSTEVSRRLSTILNLDELVAEVVNQTRDAFQYYHAQIYLFDDKKEFLVLVGGTGQAGQEMMAAGHKLALNQGLVGRAAASRQVVLISDVTQASNWLPNPLLPDTKSEAAIPILLGDEVLGVLDVQDDVVNGLNEESVALLQSIANQVAIAIQNAQQVEQTNLQYLIASELTQANTPDQILEALSGYGRQLGATSGQLLFFDNDAAGQPEWATVRAAWQSEGSGIPVGTRYYLPDFDFAPLWLSSPERPLLISDTATYEPVSPALRKLFSQIKIRATITLPLYAQTRWIGLVVLNWNTPHIFTQRDERFLTNLAQQAFSVVEAMRAAQRTEEALQEAEQLYRVSQQLTQASNLDESLFAAAQIAIDSEAHNAILLTLDLDANQQPLWAEVAGMWSRDSQLSMPLHTRFYLPDFPFSKLWVSNPSEPIFISDVEVDPRVDEVMAMMYKEGGSISTAILPLAIATRWVGIVIISWRKQHNFTNQDKRIYRAIMGQLASLVDRTRQFERSELLSSIVDNHPDFIGVGTLEGKALYVNPSGSKMIGLAPETDISDLDASDFYTTADAERLMNEGIPDAMETGSWTAEASVITTAGDMIPVEETIGINYDADGFPASFSITMRDISERKAAEEAIRTSEQQAREFQEKLTRLHDISVILSQQETLDAIYQRAIELGRDHLGFDRLGLWLFDASMAEMHGTYSINPEGEVVEEYHLSMLSEKNPLILRMLKSKERHAVNHDTDLYHDRQVVGQGWRITGILLHEETPIGWLATDNLINQRPLQPYEPELVSLFAATLASVIINKQAEQSLSKQAQELQTVAEVSRIATTILDTGELLQRVADLTKERFNLYHAHIYLVSQDEQSLILTAGAGEVGRQMVTKGHQISVRQKQSLVARAARQRQGVIVHDVRAEEGFLPNPLLPDTRSELATPLISGEEVLGVLDIQSDQEHYFTETDIDIQTTLAAQIATALQNANQYQRTQEALEELTRMQQTLIQEGWESFFTAKEQTLKGYIYNLRELQPLKHNGTAVAEDPDADAPPSTDAPDTAEPGNGGTAVVTPLTVRGATIGTLGVRDPSGRPVPADKQHLLNSISQQVAEALERARLFEESETSRHQLNTRARQLAAINQVATAVAQQLEPEQLLVSVYEQVKEVIPTDSFHISFYDEAANQLEIQVNFEDGNQLDPLTIPLTPASKSYQVIHSGKPLLVALTPAEVEELKQAVQDTTQTAPNIMGDTDKPPTATQLFVPLQSGARVFGVLSVQSYAYDAYSQDDLEMLTGIASYVAVGLENSRLFAQTQERAEELAVINQVAQTVSQQLDIDQVLETVHAQISQVMTVDAFSVSRYEQATNVLEYLYIFDSGEKHEQAPALLTPDTMSYQIVTTGQPILANLTPEELEQQTTPTVGVAKLPPSAMFAPLIIGSQTIGVISVQSYAYNEYTENDMNLLLGIANHMAVALENARLFSQTQAALAETQQRTEELALVNDIVTQLGGSLDIQEAMSIVAGGLVRGLGVDQSRIALFDESKENLVIVAESFDEAQNESALGLQIPLAGNELTLEVMRTRQPVVIADALDNPLTLPVRDILATQGIRTLAVLPMLVGNEVIGTVGLDIISKEKVLAEEMVRLAETIIFQAAAAIQNARLFAQTEAALAEVRTLFDISARLNAATNFDEVIQAAFAPGAQAGAAAGSLFKFELDGDGRVSWAEVVANTSENPVMPVGTRLHLPDLPFAALWLESQEGALLVGDVEQDERIDDASRAVLSQTKTRAFAFMTLMVGNRFIGEITLRWSEPHSFSEADRRLYTSISAQTASVVESLLLLDEIQERARELEESTNFLDSIVENLPVMVFVKDAEDLRFVRWNKAGSEITGHPAETFIGKTDYDFFPEEEAEHYISKDREVLNSRKTLEIPDEPIQTVHQGVRTLHTRKVPILDANGNPKYLLGISEDITERRQFEAALAKRAMELQTVAEISTSVASTLEASRLLQDVVELTWASFELYHVHIYLLNEAGDTLELTASSGAIGQQMVAEGRQIPLNSQQSLVAQAARTRQGVIVNDVLADEDFLPHPSLPDTRAEMAVPMIVGNQVIGIMDVQSDEKDHFTSQDINIQMTLASQVATALQNTRLFAQTESALEEVQALFNVSAQLNAATTLDEAIAAASAPALAAGAESGTLFTIELNAAGKPEWGVLETTTNPDPILPVGIRIPIGHLPSAQLRLATGEDFLIIEDVAQDERLDDHYKELMLQTNTQACIIMTLSVGQRQRGTIYIRWAEPHAFTESDRRLFKSIQPQVASIVDSISLLSETEARAAELATINAISEVASSQLDLSTLMQTVGLRLQDTFDAHAVYLSLYDEATNMMTFPFFHSRDEGLVENPSRKADKDGGLTGQIINSRQPLLLELSSNEEAKVKGAHLSGSNPRITDSYLGVPMVVGDKVIGVIGLSSYREVRMYNEQDQNLLMTLAGTIGVAIQNAQQFESTRRRAERERIVNEITQKIQSSLSMESALQTAVKELGQALGAKYTQVDLKLDAQVPSEKANGSKKRKG